MIRIDQIKIGTDVTDIDQAIHHKICRELNIRDYKSHKIVRHSIDARKKPELFHVYTVDADVEDEAAVLKRCRSKHAVIAKNVPYIWPEGKAPEHRPVIIGMGPAGLFCGYMLAEAGCRPILCDRGKPVRERTADVEEYWKTGRLDTDSNVQFGEGGAGTFSDGKLNTLVNDKYGRNAKVLDIFVDNGAPKDILYESKPHIGTDILRDVVENMRDKMIAMGAEFRYGYKLTDIDASSDSTVAVFENGERITSDALVLAIGHSARDTFAAFNRLGIPMSPKAFAVGLRVLHPQELIDASQYGSDNVGKLAPASYKLTYNREDGRGIYSFCMCPGGYVVDASSESGRMAVNGMSLHDRDSGIANSGIIVMVTPDDYDGDDALSGVRFQQHLEEKAYKLGDGAIPVQSYLMYEQCGTDDPDTKVDGIKGRYHMTDMSSLLPKDVRDAFVEGMAHFDHIIPGFAGKKAYLAGIESRTSSPVRIHRNEHGLSEYKDNIYPCGEGAGYAGGIMSAAMDGIYIAEEIWKRHSTVS